MTRWAVLIAALLATSSAEAQCLGFQCPPGVLGAAASGASPPLNGFTQPAAAYSFRKLLSAYAGSAVKLRRTTGGTLDIGFTAGGDFDTAAAATFCAATTCFLDTWYDQSGFSRNATQATAANQPAYIADFGGGLPCAEITTTTQRLDSPSITWASAIVSMSAVGSRTVGTGRCYFAGKTGSYFDAPPVANNWHVTDFVTEFNMAAADNAWHAGIAVFNGASSLGRIDATEMAGTAIAGSSAVSGLFIATGEGASTTCREREAIVWGGYALTLAERTALTANQQQYWMPLPLDSFTTPAAAYSMRKLRSAYTGPAIRLRRASDNAETDINFLSYTGFTGAPLDVATAQAFCASTSCFGRTWYDQSGAATDLPQATPANQMQLVFNCVGTLPCFRATAGAQNFTGPSITPATGVVSLSAVGSRTISGGACVFIRQNGSFGNRIVNPAAANLVSLNGVISPASADNVWHSMQGVVNGASSVFNVDGTETTGSITGSITANSTGIFGANTVTCTFGEAVVWDNYALTATERTALQTNQKSFWGTP